MKRSKRAFISLAIASVSVLMVGTSFYTLLGVYHYNVVLLHVLSGIVFTVFLGFHVLNNAKPILSYLRRHRISLIFVFSALVVLGLASPDQATDYARDLYFKSRVNGEKVTDDTFKVYPRATGVGNLSVTVKSSTHFWFPQIAIWLEDEEGNYLETLFVTFSSAKGVFYGNRTPENFKDFDGKRDGSNVGEYRRVDALPHWSHQRNEPSVDGIYAPSRDHPLPDAITGATPSGNFILKSQASTDTVVVKMEVNVAFDENEYYSEFSFPDDEAYHSGTGLLGQPSIIFESPKLSLSGESVSHFLQLVGKGHHSGAHGAIDPDLSGLTTALDLISWAVVEVNP